jgi:hypothetical protein
MLQALLTFHDYPREIAEVNYTMLFHNKGVCQAYSILFSGQCFNCSHGAVVRNISGSFDIRDLGSERYFAGF